MFRKSMLVASLIVLSAMATTAGAAVNKLPHDDCQKWVKREVVKNFWLKRQKVDRWYCVAGESKEHVTPEKGPSFAGKPRGNPNTPGASDTPDDPQPPETTTISTTTIDTPPGDDEPGKGNNGRGTQNGGPNDGGDPPGGGNTDNDGQG